MTDQKKNEQRKKFTVTIEEHVPFDPIAGTKYLTSNDLCKMTSELFRGIFADFEGCIFNASSGEPMIELIFNHGKYEEGATVACSMAGSKDSGSDILNRTRNRDRQLREGDRYYLTEDGMDLVETLLIPRMYNNGKPKWAEIVGDHIERNMVNMYSYQQQPQYTRVSFIDLRSLAKFIFGDKDKNGEDVDYSVAIAAALTPNPTMGYQGVPMNQNYMLTVTQVFAKEIAAIYERLGFGTMGTHIVR